MSLLTARPSSSVFVVEDPCFLNVDERPDWQGQFDNSQPIKLEIGFGMGDFLIEMATREPHSNFIGIDFSQDGIRKLLARIKNLSLKNIRVVYGDVREKIPLLFHDDELDTVYVNFPDPWPRRRHFKRRLIKPKLVKLVAQKLAPEGCVYLATDSEPYAREISEYFNAEPLLQNRTREFGFLQTRNNLPKTKYEKSFIYAGDKIHYLEYSRLAVEGQVEQDVSSTKQEAETSSHDERVTKAFKDAEANAKDACDLKQVGDHLAYAGDRQWAEKVYKKAEDKAEDCLDFNWLAYSVSEALGDKKWAKKLYIKAEDRAESSLDLNWLAYSVTEILGDKEWAKKLYNKAEDNPQNVRELCDLADSISETFGDNDWQIKVYKKAEGMAKEHSDFYELADSICVKLGDKKWARELYAKAEETAQDSSDLNSLVESLVEKLGDKKWAENVFKKAEALAQDSTDFCCLADSICEKLGDKEWAKKLYKKAEEKAEGNFEFRWLADSLFEKLGDKNWAEQIFSKSG
ncbi:MAG: tRNA (guanosine(46)-N7)-methyltransferase TrmB [Nitrospinae bacterium]|nr:tRNA (guanosine(46)-N7)-methyltransferase TrmB [Nitrospinota bacterium]MBL7020844.1 tRNA (guanosine(46)-N7)-methyltransferase TrmB [Nitrospinaceae bacterium]